MTSTRRRRYYIVQNTGSDTCTVKAPVKIYLNDGTEAAYDSTATDYSAYIQAGRSYMFVTDGTYWYQGGACAL